MSPSTCATKALQLILREDSDFEEPMSRCNVEALFMGTWCDVSGSRCTHESDVSLWASSAALAAGAATLLRTEDRVAELFFLFVAFRSERAIFIRIKHPQKTKYLLAEAYHVLKASKTQWQRRGQKTPSADENSELAAPQEGSKSIMNLKSLVVLAVLIAGARAQVRDGFAMGAARRREGLWSYARAQ
jgi:hypothetical protein